jgi:hypothetical protein
MPRWRSDVGEWIFQKVITIVGAMAISQKSRRSAVFLARREPGLAVVRDDASSYDAAVNPFEAV